MNTTDLLQIRLHNQLLTETTLTKPQDIVAYMGAMQSQTFELAKWAIGVRLADTTNTDVEQAINTGKIVRTHILRPTWHFVAAEDIHWMLELSTPRVKPMFLGYGKSLGLDPAFVTKACGKLEKILRDENHLTRQELVDAFKIEGIETNVDIVNYLMGLAEQDRIVCNGRLKGNKQTYALLDEWVPTTCSLPKEEAIERLVRRFFVSHGPATLHDFVWWSGLTLTDARKAIDALQKDFISEEINGRTFWMKNDLQQPIDPAPSALLLPPFDEFVVSYKDRSEIVKDKHYAKVMTKNGLFSPTVMYNGEIIGSWKRITKKTMVDTEITFFERTNKKQRDLFIKASLHYSDFYR